MNNYTVKEIAELLKVNPETVRRWIRTNKLKSEQPSRKEGNVIFEKELDIFLKNNPKYLVYKTMNNNVKRYRTKIDISSDREIIIAKDHGDARVLVPVDIYSISETPVYNSNLVYQQQWTEYGYIVFRYKYIDKIGSRSVEIDDKIACVNEPNLSLKEKEDIYYKIIEKGIDIIKLLRLGDKIVSCMKNYNIKVNMDFFKG